MNRNLFTLGVSHIAVLSMLALPMGEVAAASRDWKFSVANGNWSTATNWVQGIVPAANDIVSIGAAGDPNLHAVTYDYAGGPVTLASLGIDFAGAGTAATTLSMSANNLTALAEYIGYFGRGTLDHSGGTNTLSPGGGLLDVASTATGLGMYNLSGNGVLNANNHELIGNLGTGIFTQNGGTNSIIGAINNLYVGYTSGALGTYTLNSGTLSVAGSEFIGYSATGNASQNGGRFFQTGGSHFITGNLSIGTNSGAKGSYAISNSGSLVAGNAIIGVNGTGTMTIQDQASVHISNNLNIGTLGSISFSGGILRFDTVTGTSLSRLNYTGGAIKLATQRFVGTDSTISTLFGASPTVPTGKGLTVEGPTRIQTNVNVNGGRFIGLSNVEVGIAGGSPVTVAISNGGYAHSESELAVGSGDVTTAAGVVTVDGAGSLLETFGNVSLGHAAAGTLQVTGGASATTGGNAVIGSTNGQGNATVSGPGSTWNITGNLGLTGSGTGAGLLNIQNQGTVSVGGALTIDPNNSVNLSGGKLRLNTVTGTSLDRLNYTSGIVQLSGDRNVNSDQVVQKLFGLAPVIPAGKTLTVEGAATLTAPMTLNGGSFSAQQLLGQQHVQLQHGLLDVQNQAATFAQGGVVDLAADVTINYGLGITNDGILKGDGQLGGPFFNSSLGEMRGEAGKSLKFTGASNINNGAILMQGGTMEFNNTLQNSLGSSISGSGTLTSNGDVISDGSVNVTGQLTMNAANIKLRGQLDVANAATMNAFSNSLLEISAGTTNVDHGTIAAVNGIRFGNQQMVDEADIISVVTAAVQEQYRDNQETLASAVEELRQANQLNNLISQQLQNYLQQQAQNRQAAQTVLDVHCVTCPSVVANLRSTISADTEMLGKLVAGGPAGLSTVDVNGDLSFAPDSTLELELAGTNSGQYDKVAVNGHASFEIGTTLKLSLLDPANPQSGTNYFLPEPGDYFDVLTANTLDAEFMVIVPPPQSLLNFVAGVFNSGNGQVLRITVVPVFVALPGDFNNDGTVDAADYVVWRDNNNSTAVLANDPTPGLVNVEDYDLWRSHFGQSAPTASGAVLTSVPEPAGWLLASRQWCR